MEIHLNGWSQLTRSHNLAEFEWNSLKVDLRALHLPFPLISRAEKVKNQLLWPPPSHPALKTWQLDLGNGSSRSKSHIEGIEREIHGCTFKNLLSCHFKIMLPNTYEISTKIVNKSRLNYLEFCAAILFTALNKKSQLFYFTKSKKTIPLIILSASVGFVFPSMS